MPARAIEDEDNLLVGTRADLAREGGQLHLEQSDGDRGRQMEDGPARGRMDETDDVAPRIAVLDRSDRSLPDRRPDAAQDGLEANAMLVGRPQLDLGARKRRRETPWERAEVFLKAACASGSG